MNQEHYFVIYGSEDGGSMERLTKELLLKRLNEGYYGEKEVLSELPEDIDNFNGLVIIKGSLVVPTAKKVVTEFELP